MRTFEGFIAIHLTPNNNKNNFSSLASSTGPRRTRSFRLVNNSCVINYKANFLVHLFLLFPLCPLCRERFFDIKMSAFITSSLMNGPRESRREYF